MAVFVCCTVVYAADPAKEISRKCPVEWVEQDDEYLQAVLDGPEWNGGKVRVIGECTYDARAITSWAEAQGIKCRIASTTAKVGRRRIRRGHWTVIPDGSRYTVDFVAGLGIVTRRIDKDDVYEFLDEFDTTSEALEMRPVRSVDFTTVPEDGDLQLP